MDELEQIRMRKMQELQNEMNAQTQQESMMQQQFDQVEFAVKTKMTKDAISRYGNLKAAHPEKAMHALIIMARALETRQVTQINDDILKHFLGALTPQKKEFKLNRV